MTEEYVRKSDVVKVLTNNRVHFGDMVKITSEMKDLETLRAKPCEDCVSREAVREGMTKYGFRAALMTVAKFVEDELPSVTSKQKTGDFTRQELEDWLYSICLNNVGTDFCKYIEEIISRLDGFERYVEDMREESNERCH